MESKSDTPITNAIVSAEYEFPYQLTKELTYHCREFERLYGAAKIRADNLEIALKAARQDRARTLGYGEKIAPARLGFQLNELSEDDVAEQFKTIAYHAEQDKKAKMAEQEDAADLKSAGHTSMSVRSRLLAPLAKLFQRF